MPLFRFMEVEAVSPLKTPIICTGFTLVKVGKMKVDVVKDGGDGKACTNDKFDATPPSGPIVFNLCYRYDGK
ncbi:hypothetical protein GCM10009621_15820 [Corynebacterium felinum]